MYPTVDREIFVVNFFVDYLYLRKLSAEFLCNLRTLTYTNFGR